MRTEYFFVGSQLSSGYDVTAATICPGRSISGIISILRSAAYATISRNCSCVKNIPRPYSVSSKNFEPSPGLVNEPERTAPTSVSKGYSGISMRQPWSSVRCQWKRLSL